MTQKEGFWHKLLMGEATRRVIRSKGEAKGEGEENKPHQY
jgi:hypothetical protein